KRQRTIKVASQPKQSFTVAKRRKFLNQSSNYVDLAVAAYDLDTTGNVTLIPTIPQGTTVSTRVGKRVMIKSLQIRGLANSNSATTIALGSYMIVHDKRPTVTIPAVTDILVSANFNSFTNDNNTSRFTILKRKNFTFIGNENTAGEQTDKTGYHVNDFLRINKNMSFNALGTGVIADIDEGALYLLCVGNQTGTAAAGLTIGFRTRFVDTMG
ncbi:capsid/nuclear shuttle family protein, partial [Shewanella sp.]|uniref:capsid/nuclear shuttle family protein n=1 Tax=Shewanella sp. TaxID=50422 RepID=UPI004047547F